ncbi:hypothetical protein [Mumia sp. DW29H23]|uniref:hypothetical protein n=1 Tax=Mumia sp. DW29H23 TaxID=3421241 RepID=UPI003D682516
MHPSAATTTRSYAFENAVFAMIIPATALLVPWVWFGRAFLGAGGWYLLFFAFTVVPLLVLTLGATTVLAFTQRRPAGTGRLTTRQACAHLLLWVALAAFGFFVVDFGDASDSANSVLTVAGDGGETLRDLSTTLSLVAGAVAAAAWLWLLVELVVGNTESKRRRDADASRQWQQWQAWQAQHGGAQAYGEHPQQQPGPSWPQQPPGPPRT